MLGDVPGVADLGIVKSGEAPQLKLRPDREMLGRYGAPTWFGLGELNGRIPGKVLFGGADYQNLSGPPAIDARYLWQANNGDIILSSKHTKWEE